MQPTNYATSLSSQFVADYPHEQYWCGLPPFSVISLSRASLRLMPPGAYEATSPTPILPTIVLPTITTV